MKRGTTPTIILSTNADLTGYDEIWVTFSQNNQIILNKKLSLSQVTVATDSISVPLSQADTLTLGAGEVKVQVRALDGQNAIASDIVSTTVGAILIEGEIS